VVLFEIHARKKKVHVSNQPECADEHYRMKYYVPCFYDSHHHDSHLFPFKTANSSSAIMIQPGALWRDCSRPLFSVLFNEEIRLIPPVIDLFPPVEKGGI